MVVFQRLLTEPEYVRESCGPSYSCHCDYVRLTIHWPCVRDWLALLPVFGYALSRGVRYKRLTKSVVASNVAACLVFNSFHCSHLMRREVGCVLRMHVERIVLGVAMNGGLGVVEFWLSLSGSQAVQVLVFLGGPDS